ncbi:AlbA family DNA-binding domain-containing protein [Mucilaginibacter polytrichastri]|uniref:Schlafen AlbA-2 domain-containing protein n=1 Tax=Mucilaginibacter polytrichastri TaxID=1302689 RepID=A0A1Q5ZVN5_9SPHI|nr:ATP-binding protein [Mucilaginibacter polytrichastri]OKS85837.1 hypothetical protein RG47T_1283 [Mucilaginibacter polytrichastri]SFS61162.1 Putative DNA-binding domain-containing protein [Mucilaginibacter polytrichastri]
MDIKTIELEVKNTILKSLAGSEAENPKIDCKAKWYDLKQESQIHEFLKDTSAIANTFGLDGYIIIGYDTKSQNFTDSYVKDSNLKDESEIMGIIARHVESVYTVNVYDIMFEDHKLSVIHIPPSLYKPHVIKNYKRFKQDKITDHLQRIFVRKGTTTAIANKNDLELMYYDRKNIIPDYDVRVNANAVSKNFLMNSTAGVITYLGLQLNLIVENIGKRPIAIVKFAFRRAKYLDDSKSSMVDLESEKLGPMVLNASEMKSITVKFNTIGVSGEHDNKFFYQYYEGSTEITAIKSIVLHLSNGKTINTEMTEF